MVNVARIDVRAGCKEQIDDWARPREMEWRLTIPAALVYARRIFGDHSRKEVGPVEVRRRASIGDGAGRNQSVRGGTSRGVQSVKSARSPIAAPVGVSPEVE